MPALLQQRQQQRIQDKPKITLSSTTATMDREVLELRLLPQLQIQLIIQGSIFITQMIIRRTQLINLSKVNFHLHLIKITTSTLLIIQATIDKNTLHLWTIILIISSLFQVVTILFIRIIQTLICLHLMIIILVITKLAYLMGHLIQFTSILNTMITIIILHNNSQHIMEVLWRGAPLKRLSRSQTTIRGTHSIKYHRPLFLRQLREDLKVKWEEVFLKDMKITMVDSISHREY